MQRMLKRPGTAPAEPKAEYATAPKNGGCDAMTAACVSELMNAATSFHKLHLKVTGTGSFAAHKALNELYDALPGHADDLAEGYQGASEKLLSYSEASPRSLKTVADAIDYLNEMKSMVDGLQAKMPYTEIVNDLDTIKSTLNSAKYKLIFLK
jgi:DNA-binding ferritin-like protein